MLIKRWPNTEQMKYETCILVSVDQNDLSVRHSQEVIMLELLK